jgi:hypothetical protein
VIKRSLDLGFTYSTTFKIFKARFLPFISIGAIASVILFVPLTIMMAWWISMIVDGLSFEYSQIATPSQVMVASAILAVYIFLSVLVSWWATLSCCTLANGEWNAQPLSLGEACRAGLARLSSLVPIAALAGFAYGLGIWGSTSGFIAFFDWAPRANEDSIIAMLTIFLVVAILLSIAACVVVIILTVRWFVALPVIAVEHKRIWPALGRSSQITKGSRGMIFIVMLLVSIALSIAIQTITLPASLASLNDEFTTVWFIMGISCLFSVITVPIMPIISLVVYRDRLQWVAPQLQ